MNEAYQAIVDVVFPYHPHMTKIRRMINGNDNHEYYYFLAMYKDNVVREFLVHREIARIRDHRAGDRTKALLELSSEGNVSEDYESFLSRKSADSVRAILAVDMSGWSLTEPEPEPPAPVPYFADVKEAVPEPESYPDSRATFARRWLQHYR
jgi:hypothetical protein